MDARKLMFRRKRLIYTANKVATSDNALKKSRWKRRQRANNAKIYARLPEYHRIK